MVVFSNAVDEWIGSGRVECQADIIGKWFDPEVDRDFAS
jgi:hypothetical protein